MVSAHIIVTGRVQGVGFRAFVVHEVNKIGNITGWVRNLYDVNRVEIIADGKSENIDNLVSKLWQGPHFSDVNNVEVKKEEIKQSVHKTFRITF